MNIKLSKIILVSALILAMSFAVAQGKEKKMEIKLTSSAFKDGALMPAKYTVNGENVSPPLHWENIPANAKTIAIINDDPDSFGGNWVHWVIFNIPAKEKGLPENMPPKRILDNNAKQGLNNFSTIGYKGPAPPSGVHRYMFKIYALDLELALDPGATKQQLLKAMEGHILARGELMGRYTQEK
jgi:Raf kinase inhibitor-like YbhB/YbcL family protein